MLYAKFYFFIFDYTYPPFNQDEKYKIANQIILIKATLKTI